MSTPSYRPYRNCTVDVRVTPGRTHALGGAYRRYRVVWTVSSPGRPDGQVVSFPEQFDFLSEQDALRYGEKRAHTFIDSLFSTPQRHELDSDHVA
ncbi:hypothetical protein [Burkholderia sp. Ac-20365]|uniref:hypothetical protein n=1 Tax=Burkholderia sp. Ac-20365 TaxID=2703897 RepID=UPI00197C7A3F|nr:hypothetical protein [Burkholderia sp. Ac-20365]MBN3760839.1 hypothetical protein [Burkholderia sp. Ac-20365]